MIRPFRALAVVGAVVLAAACGRESPTSVGSSLLTGGGARTFEIVLDASQFLRADTSLSGFVLKASSAAFLVVANQFGGEVDAHILARFLPPPKTITVLDSTGTQKTDTLPSFFKGTVVLHVDSTALPLETTPVALQLFRTAQDFDPNSATWLFRLDTGTVHLPWAVPGGVTGALVDTATWQPGQDSVVFHVDSTTVARWADTTNLGRGALVAAINAGTRMRFRTIVYNVSAHSSIKRDTVVTSSPGDVGSIFVFNPNGPAPQPGILRIGGIPAWRSYFTFQPDLVTRTLSCPASTGVSCSFTLKTVTVNFAGILLQPAPAGPWLPEDSVRPEAFTLDTATNVPLSRSPLGVHLGTTAPAVAPALFGSPPATSPVVVPVTAFIAALAGDTIQAGGSAAAQSNTVSVLHFPEPGLLGVGSFYSRAAGPPLAPRLRLIVTIAPQVQLP